jgi:hypothetical protein
MKVLIVAIQYNTDTIAEDLQEIGKECVRHRDTLGVCGQTDGGAEYDYQWEELEDHFIATLFDKRKDELMAKIVEKIQDV